MRKFLLSLLILPLGGCMWVCRVPVPVVEQFSEAGECTNRVWRSMVTDVRYKGGTNNVLWCYYPTLQIRIEPWKDLYGKPIDPALTGEDLYKAKWRKRMGWLPLTLSWIGAPLDLVVDTLMLPYDYYWFHQ